MTAATTGKRPGATFRELVAAEIRAHLARRKMSQRALARAVGKTHVWMNTRLSGAMAIDTDDLELIADALGMDPLDLLAGVPTGGRAPARQGHFGVKRTRAYTVTRAARCGARSPVRRTRSLRVANCYGWVGGLDAAA